MSGPTDCIFDSIIGLGSLARSLICRFAAALPKHCAGNSLRHFPYNKVTDESPPAGAAKHRVPDYNDKNSTETKAAESKQTRTL
jgi:hypothetical protein